jgi:hypothetical protein
MLAERERAEQREGAEKNEESSHMTSTRTIGRVSRDLARCNSDWTDPFFPPPLSREVSVGGTARDRKDHAAVAGR